MPKQQPALTKLYLTPSYSCRPCTQVLGTWLHSIFDFSTVYEMCMKVRKHFCKKKLTLLLHLNNLYLILTHVSSILENQNGLALPRSSPSFPLTPLSLSAAHTNCKIMCSTVTMFVKQELNCHCTFPAAENTDTVSRLLLPSLSLYSQ